MSITERHAIPSLSDAQIGKYSVMGAERGQDTVIYLLVLLFLLYFLRFLIISSFSPKGHLRIPVRSKSFLGTWNMN